ncbi:unnamed protein product [Parnassius apollo]|uniref:(apollo) hypothetical protein n=1 Tax=Parnassius apollo TaxID=110799 RepID=A0A8S3XJ00_PARAO|nr:unnamed protein product [Parnassius apollo]
MNGSKIIIGKFKHFKEIMADDIDIEEHDLMDNPVIRNIFPDLSILKKEVLDEYNDISTIEETLNKEEESLNSNSENDINFISVPKVNGEWSDRDMMLRFGKKRKVTNDKVPDVDESSTVAIHKNKIILGSKPSRELIQTNVGCNSDPKLNTATVLLNNLRPFLDNCNKYCEICFILFPNSKALDSHKKCLHCSLSTEKISTDIPKMDPEKQSENICLNKPKCNICLKTFASRSSLYKHKRNIHFIHVKIRRVNKTKNVAVKIASGYKNEKISLSSNNSCFHCNKLFPNMQSLIEHLYDTLETKQDKKHSKSKKNLGIHKSHVKDIFSNSKLRQQKFEAEKVRRKKISSNNLNSYVYRCPLCSHYFNNVKFSSTHLLKKHKFTKKTPLKKVLYDPKCKFCSSEFESVVSYNRHLRKVHKNLLTRVIKTKSSNKPSKASGVNKINGMKNKISSSKGDAILEEIPNVSQTSTINTNESALGGILKSVLFKCNKCDIHFLQSQIAVNHSKHMEFLINWKCSLCNRIFKKNDELSHRQQHLVTNNFTVYGLCESTQSLILYKCLKCTVHFDENMFIQHFPICETTVPNHIQCKFCDILIDCSLKIEHDNEHRSKSINYKDFNVVRTEVIQSNIIDENLYNNNKRQLKSRVTVDSNSYESQIKNNNLDCLFTVYYCNTCKCFVNDSTLLIHKKSHCSHVVPATCKLCGLIITQTSISSHGRLHQRKKNLTLQDFKFYDLKSRKRIAPPIPEFPHCSICGIYFANQIAKIRHECGVDDYVTCSDCEMNFSELGYKLHMNYHNYRLQYHNINSKHLSQSKSGSKTKAKNIGDIKSNLTRKMPSSDLKEIERFIIYTCKNCHISVDAYDLVVEHCQRHYNPLKIQSSTKICKLCDLIFDVGCYEDHEKLHLCNFNKKDFKIIKFDIFYFTTDYDAWMKRVFDSLPQEQMQNIINKSIYKYENKIKMKVIQEASPELTVYKCDQCRCFIDPYSLYKHLGNNCLSLRKHTCRTCGIPFISATSKVQHEAIHKRPFKGLKSYRIVLFNRDEDKMFNDGLSSGNWFTLYTCRNCEGVVGKTEYKHHICNKNDLKKCSYCGLLLYSKEYNAHISKHKEFESFNAKNIKVILIGRKIENEDCKNLKDENLVSSFNGKVYDYSLYKCTKCEICMRYARDTIKHDCSFGIPKSKCSYCGFYFEARKLKHHYILHETDCNFITENITINDFDNTKSQKGSFDMAITSKLNKTDKDEITCNPFKRVKVLPSSPANLHNNKELKDSPIIEKTAKLYKCSCGLHFLDNSVKAHLNVCSAKNRISRQQCSKCGLTFSPNVLFTHMLSHHGNKAVVYKFDIIDVLKDEDKP